MKPHPVIFCELTVILNSVAGVKRQDNPLDRSSVHLGGYTIHSHSHNWEQFRVSSQSHMHVFRMCQDSGVWAETIKKNIHFCTDVCVLTAIAVNEILNVLKRHKCMSNNPRCMAIHSKYVSFAQDGKRIMHVTISMHIFRHCAVAPLCRDVHHLF